MTNEILVGWVVSGAVLGALVTPVLYLSKRRRMLPALLVGIVAGAVGNLVLLLPLWLSVARLDDGGGAHPDPALHEAGLALDEPFEPERAAPPVAPTAASISTEDAFIVVEDDPDLYQTLLTMFDIWSVDPIAFTDGADAIKWIEEMENDLSVVSIPKLALLDIRLPGEIGGPEIAERLRASPLLGNIGIVLMTAFHLTPREEREVMARSQADLLIYKPLPIPQELREMFDEVINRRRNKEGAL